MASRIAVMHHGRVLQVGTPKEIYECPINRFVADFIGNVNLFDGQLSVDEPDRCEITTDHGVMHISHGIGGAIGMPLAVAVRPEKIYIAKNRPADVSVNLFSGKVREIAYFGSYTSFVVEAASGRTVVVTEPNGSRLENIDRASASSASRVGLAVSSPASMRTSAKGSAGSAKAAAIVRARSETRPVSGP